MLPEVLVDAPGPLPVVEGRADRVGQRAERDIRGLTPDAHRDRGPEWGRGGRQVLQERGHLRPRACQTLKHRLPGVGGNARDREPGAELADGPALERAEPEGAVLADGTPGRAAELVLDQKRRRREARLLVQVAE